MTVLEVGCFEYALELEYGDRYGFLGVLALVFGIEDSWLMGRIWR